MVKTDHRSEADPGRHLRCKKSKYLIMQNTFLVILFIIVAIVCFGEYVVYLVVGIILMLGAFIMWLFKVDPYNDGGNINY